MSIVEEGDDAADHARARQRPWWLLPGLAGVVIGALIGSVIGGPLAPPSSVASRASADVRSASATATLPPDITRAPLRQTPAPEPPPGSFPPVLKPARIFVFQARAGTAPLPPGYWSLTQLSRYVLYEDGTFALQFAYSDAPLENHGTYSEVLGRIDFENWDSSSVAVSGFAYGFFEGDSLTVRYGGVMQITDYEDAVYVRR